MPAINIQKKSLNAIYNIIKNIKYLGLNLMKAIQELYADPYNIAKRN